MQFDSKHQHKGKDYQCRRVETKIAERWNIVANNHIQQIFGVIFIDQLNPSVQMIWNFRLRSKTPCRKLTSNAIMPDQMLLTDIKYMSISLGAKIP